MPSGHPFIWWWLFFWWGCIVGQVWHHCTCIVGKKIRVRWAPWLRELSFSLHCRFWESDLHREEKCFCVWIRCLMEQTCLGHETVTHAVTMATFLPPEGPSRGGCWWPILTQMEKKAGHFLSLPRSDLKTLHYNRVSVKSPNPKPSDLRSCLHLRDNIPQHKSPDFQNLHLSTQ